MSKRPSIKKQVIEQLNSLTRFGESRHKTKMSVINECKKQGVKFTNGMIPHIYSYNTYEAYKASVMQFVNYLRENNIKPRYLDDITKKQAVEYLKYKEQNGYSKYTIDRDIAAINKVWSFEITKKTANLEQKHIKDITRSRFDREMDHHYNQEHYKKQILCAKAFGLRRESIHKGNYALKENSIFRKGYKVYCSVIEKGGRYREAPCLEKYKEQIIETFRPTERESFQYGYKYNEERDYYTPKYAVEDFREYYKSEEIGQPIFDSYSSRIDNHAFRREYAQELYEEIKKEVEEDKQNYRGYDRDIVLEVSNALGHNREDVVVNYYLK